MQKHTPSLYSFKILIYHLNKNNLLEILTSVLGHTYSLAKVIQMNKIKIHTNISQNL
jgi:hypothetical protein